MLSCSQHISFHLLMQSISCHTSRLCHMKSVPCNIYDAFTNYPADRLPVHKNSKISTSPRRHCVFDLSKLGPKINPRKSTKVNPSVVLCSKMMRIRFDLFCLVFAVGSEVLHSLARFGFKKKNSFPMTYHIPSIYLNTHPMKHHVPGIYLNAHPMTYHVPGIYLNTHPMT